MRNIRGRHSVRTVWCEHAALWWSQATGSCKHTEELEPDHIEPSPAPAASGTHWNQAKCHNFDEIVNKVTQSTVGVFHDSVSIQRQVSGVLRPVEVGVFVEKVGAFHGASTPAWCATKQARFAFAVVAGVNVFPLRTRDTVHRDHVINCVVFVAQDITTIGVEVCARGTAGTGARPSAHSDWLRV